MIRTMLSIKDLMRSKYLIPILVILLSLGVLIFINNFFDIRSLNQSTATQLYFVDNISAAHRALIDKFNAKYRGQIEVIGVDLPFSKFSTNERKELLARALRSKSDRIDLFAVDVIWVPRFARWAQPLDSHFSINEREPLLSQAMTSCYYQDQLVAIPLYIDVGLMYYRRDLVQQLPHAAEIESLLQQSITWEELIELSRKLPDKSTPFYLFAAKNFEGLVCSFWENLLISNQSLFVGDTVNFNTPETRRALAFLVDLMHEYQMTPLDMTRFDEFQVYVYALQNDALFFRGWPGFLRNQQGLFDDEKLAMIGHAPLPHFEGHARQAVFGGWNLMVSKFSTSKPAALEFIKFALLPENQKLFYEIGGYIPINTAVYQDSLFLSKNEYLEYYRRLLDSGIHRPFTENYTRISDILSNYIYLALKKEITVEAALQRATEDINSQQPAFK